MTAGSSPIVGRENPRSLITTKLNDKSTEEKNEVQNLLHGSRRGGIRYRYERRKLPPVGGVAEIANVSAWLTMRRRSRAYVLLEGNRITRAGVKLFDNRCQDNKKEGPNWP